MHMKSWTDDEFYQFAVCGQAQNPLNLHEELAMAYNRWRSVFVRTYTRRRFGRRESVCQHWRSHPGQMQLFA